MLNWRDPHNPRSGGAERVTEGYLSALAGRGHEVFWYANQFPGSAREEQHGNFQIIRGGGVGSSILEARRWFLTQPRFDLVIDQHHGIPWFAPWWCRTHCIAYVHEVLGPIWRTFYKRPWCDIGQLQERWTHRLYRNVHFWTACESTRDGLRAHGIQQVSIIRYGVHTQALSSLDPKPLNRPLRLAIVTRLAPNKRVNHGIQALRILVDRGIDAKLDIVGDGDMRNLLREETHQLHLEDRVNFTGLIDEEQKDAILEKAHLLLHTSVREGWGLNVIEANAKGTPAVVYPVEGLKESTLHDQTGLLSVEQTPQALADRILELQGDQERYERLRRGAWERAKSLHWDQVLPRACDWLEARARGEDVTAVPVS